MRRSCSVALALGWAAALVVDAVALAHLPVQGAAKEYPDYTTLTYHWASSAYPSWFYSSMTTAFGSDWPASAYNNTRMPTFTYSSTGAGTVLVQGDDGHT